jgi:RIO-like serine/threonine protein kinase
LIEPLTNRILRLGHATLRDGYRGANPSHLLVLARLAATPDEWLCRNTISTSTLIGARHTRDLLENLLDWSFVESREVNRRGDREFKLRIGGIHTLAAGHVRTRKEVRISKPVPNE